MSTVGRIDHVQCQGRSLYMVGAFFWENQRLDF